MLLVDHVSVVVCPGWTRLGVAVKEPMVPDGVQLYGVLGDHAPLLQVNVCEVQGGVDDRDAVTVLPEDTGKPLKVQELFVETVVVHEAV